MTEMEESIGEREMHLSATKESIFMKTKLLINYYKDKFVHVISRVVSCFYSDGRKKDI